MRKFMVMKYLFILINIITTYGLYILINYYKNTNSITIGFF